MFNKLPTKLKLTSFFLVLLSLISLSFYIGRVYADDVAPIPQARLPCDQTGDPEFDSLRPYQAAPCGDYSAAFFCGNQINIVETKSKTQQGIHDSLPVDWWNGGTPAGKDYWIDLSETQLPILGNTELVQNSQNSKDQIDDTTKMNEYASWYLNGVNNRAEYGDTKNTNYETVNLSGPIQKLLPQAIAEAQRMTTIASASAEGAATPDEDEPSAPQNGPLSHNQIVVCTQGGKPVDCYKGDGSAAQGKVYRLKDWASGGLSIITTFFNWLGTNVWDHRYPPLPWQFTDQILYEKAYNEWRGKTCAILPIINTLSCWDLPLVSNRNDFAELYPYIPLASTPDKLGKMPIFTVLVQPSAADMDVSSWDKLAAPSLYYAHTQEVKDLSETLNKTYIPQGVTSTEIPPDSTENNDLSSDPKCRILNVRTNPGDNLFPIRTPGDVGTNVIFHVNRLYNCHVEYRTNRNEREVPYTTCSGQVSIGIQTDPNKIPYANEIWKSTVAGNASTFRRIYPKVGPGAPVSCVADIPASTKAVYKPVAGTDSIGVEGPLGSPDQENMDPENAKIYFSHLGSVYDYFLKGIQTALRPKGFGEPSPISGTQCETIVPKECEINVPDSAVPSKYLGSFKSNFIDLANRWSATCPGESNNLATKCYNYVVSESQKAGVNPGFALTIWLNESGASNYCASGATAQDFGINLSSLYQNMTGQLKAFINMAKMKLCEGMSGYPEPMAGWLSRFQSSAGVCDPSDSTAMQYYVDVRDETWSWVTGCSKNGKFGITWPTDMSCP